MLTIPKPADELAFELEATGEIYTIPYAKDLPIDYAERLAALEHATSEEVLSLLREILNHYAPGAWEHLTADGLALILEAWKGRLGE